MPHDLLIPTDRGLYCEAGGFYIDPWRSVDRAVITHAHTDHAHWGCGHYLATETCAPILRARLGQNISLQALAYSQPLVINDVTLTFHPAGHVLGSAQIRLQHRSGTWLVSGDYKLQRDPTAEPFEHVRADVFITESTFGLPIFRWPDPAEVVRDVNRWWAANIEQSRTSIIYAYSLGKAQRILAALDQSLGPILIHGSLAKINPCYEAAGIRLPRTHPANNDEAGRFKGKAIVIAPPGTEHPTWLRKFGVSSTATASGWMRIRGTRRRLATDRGFVLSDHADWPDLLRAIDATGAARIGITHGSTETLCRWLREQGRDAFIVPTRYTGEQEAPEPPPT